MVCGREFFTASLKKTSGNLKKKLLNEQSILSAPSPSLSTTLYKSMDYILTAMVAFPSFELVWLSERVVDSRHSYQTFHVYRFKTQVVADFHCQSLLLPVIDTCALNSLACVEKMGEGRAHCLSLCAVLWWYLKQRDSVLLLPGVARGAFLAWS